MGSIAGQNLIVLMLTAMEHDLNYRINHKMDSRMQLSMNSIFLATQKSDVYQNMSKYDANTKEWHKENERIKRLEQREAILDALDKKIEMELTKLQNELKMVQQRKEAAQKILDQNIKTGFSYGQG